MRFRAKEEFEFMEKKVAIITAASHGMGAACARELAGQGYALALMARSESILELARDLNAVGHVGSVTNPDDLARFKAMAMESFGRIDAVVNNTGHPPKGDLLEISDQQWLEGLDLLLLNVIRLTRQVVPVMEQQGGGAFVNISSLGACEPNPAFPVSSTIRAALSAFTKLFAARYAAKNIRMNNVLPGFVDSYEINDEIRSAIPMQRSATVKEIAKTVAFLVSGDSSYITGQNIKVDGGMGRSL